MAKKNHFPQDMIHLIQSFLTEKEAAQTSILSKSWYTAWSTRPVLIFDENKFPPNDAVSEPFSQFSRQTLNRYESLNLKLDKFVLQMNIDQSFYGLNPLADELIKSATSKLSVREIELKFNYPLGSRQYMYDIPAEVFSSNSLTRLSAADCTTNWVIGDDVLCSRLTSLVLCNVYTTDNVVKNILVKCPLIEILDLCRCDDLERLNVSKLVNLTEFIFIVSGSSKKLTNVEFNNGINVVKFRFLRRLHLDRVRIEEDFFTLFSYMFPNIEDLNLGYFEGYGEINISSHSLKCLSLHEGEGLKKVHLNVPNISKIVFNLLVDTVGGHINPLPSLSFGSVPKDLESHVKLSSTVDVVEANWFVNLRKFLIELSFSRIYLSITFDEKSILDEEIPCFSFIPVVENLTVCTCSSSNTTQNILAGLCRTCCPNVIVKCNGCFNFFPVSDNVFPHLL